MVLIALSRKGCHWLPSSFQVRPSRPTMIAVCVRGEYRELDGVEVLGLALLSDQ